MRKITLDLEALDVQTFETAVSQRGLIGTVKANDSDPTAGGFEDTCGRSCTCFHACYSPQGSCPCELTEAATCACGSDLNTCLGTPC
jgi:hypothetical protein